MPVKRFDNKLLINIAKTSTVLVNDKKDDKHIPSKR